MQEIAGAPSPGDFGQRRAAHGDQGAGAPLDGAGAQLDVALTQRLPEPIDTATYYLVAETLTNAAKHAHASAVYGQVDADDTAAAPTRPVDPG